MTYRDIDIWSGFHNTFNGPIHNTVRQLSSFQTGKNSAADIDQYYHFLIHSHTQEGKYFPSETLTLSVGLDILKYICRVAEEGPPV